MTSDQEAKIDVLIAKNGGTSEKVWRDRVLFFLALVGSISMLSTFVFITRGEHQTEFASVREETATKLSSKADKVKFEGHEKLKAHPVGEATTDLRLAGIENLIKEMAVRDEPMTRSQVRRITRPRHRHSGDEEDGAIP